MTPANERLMEHYRRVAYANLRFSEDAEMKQGADSDRGRIYIRYGAPVERFITTSTVGPDQLWSYEDFSVSFMRLRGRPWQYRNGLREKKEYRTIARLEAVFPPSSKEAERWQRIPLMCRPVQFRGENGRTRLDLHVSVREHQVQSGKGPKGARRVHLEHGILAMQDWKVVESAIQNVDYLAWIKGTKEGGYLLRSDYLTVDAGVYQVMIESLDDDAGFLGTYLDTVEVRSFEGTGLALSDLAINRRSVTRPGGKGRKGTVFLSAPEGTGVRGKTLEVFAEVYNLAVYTKPDSTRYSTSFSVRSEGEAEEWTVVSSEQHRGDARWEPITLKLDLAVSAPGPKQLRLRLTDHARSETIETTAPFRVVW